MKIASYNVWYPEITMRTKQLLEEINKADADVIGLQEVPLTLYENIIQNCKYEHCRYVYYGDESEGENMGLVLLCKYPIVEHFSLFDSAQNGNSIAHNIIFEKDGVRFSVTNVHLPWDSALAKEKQIVAVDQFIHNQKDDAHFFILLGDFNCSLSSSVHHYLLGDQTLLGSESKPCWNDLASAHAVLNAYTVAPTLDFVNNPRWQGKNTVYIPETYDRIYIMESFNWDYDFNLHNVRTFGKEVSPDTGYAPSDHYGVLADVNFKL